MGQCDQVCLCRVFHTKVNINRIQLMLVLVGLAKKTQTIQNDFYATFLSFEYLYSGLSVDRK